MSTLRQLNPAAQVNFLNRMKNKAARAAQLDPAWHARKMVALAAEAVRNTLMLHNHHARAVNAAIANRKEK